MRDCDQDNGRAKRRGPRVPVVSKTASAILQTIVVESFGDGCLPAHVLRETYTAQGKGRCAHASSLRAKDVVFMQANERACEKPFVEKEISAIPGLGPYLGPSATNLIDVVTGERSDKG